MSIVYLDPSAWVKRYLAEPGSEVMDAIWGEISRGRGQAVCHWLGFTELVWVLQRRRNMGRLDTRAFAAVYQQFRVDCEQVVWVGLSWDQVQASVVWIVRHNLNATDALHLQVALSQRALGEGSVYLVSSDRRLVRAAQVEGLVCVDPERCEVAALQGLFTFSE
jgi:predicted nucleic acid-binding protein